MLDIMHPGESSWCNMDDVGIFEKTEQQHNKCLIEVLYKFAQVKVALNKCEFSKCSLKYLGDMIFLEELKLTQTKFQPLRI